LGLDLVCFLAFFLPFVMATTLFQMAWKKLHGDAIEKKCQMILLAFSWLCVVGTLTTDNFTE
jgi:hypothetical protein